MKTWIIKNKKEILAKCVTKTAEASIKKSAEEKQDHSVLAKVQYIDLVAREVNYYSSCQKAYTRDYARNENPTEDSETIHAQNTHAAAFDNH